MAVEYIRIASTDSRLRRHVRHDDRSWLYRFPTAGLTLVSTKHTRRIGVLDQGTLGSCTGNAGIGKLGTDPFFETLTPDRTVVGLPGNGRFFGVRYSLDEAGAVQLYSDATKADDYPGTYPPTDTGCDGLTIAKVLTAAGEISGFQHTFSLQDALLALTVTPVMVGINWYHDMSTPDPDGRLRITGNLDGGHEVVVDEIDVPNQRVWLTNSWTAQWGVAGRAYLTWDDLGTLLSRKGEVTVFVPRTAPAPVPTPTPPPADPDKTFAAALHTSGFLTARHTGGAATVTRAAKTWLAARNL